MYDRPGTAHAHPAHSRAMDMIVALTLSLPPDHLQTQTITPPHNSGLSSISIHRFLFYP